MPFQSLGSCSVSLPLRERGLKLDLIDAGGNLCQVAPPAGAWIETIKGLTGRLLKRPVAPPAGAWIETICQARRTAGVRVAPPAGAWIET